MRTNRRSSAHHSEAGAASPEQLGVVITASVLLLAVIGFATPIGEQVGYQMCRATAQLTEADCQEPGSTPQAEGPDLDTPPVCTQSSTSTTRTVGARVEIIKISVGYEHEAEFVVQHRSDGTVHVELATGHAVDGDYGLRARTQDNTPEGTPGATAEAKLTVGGEVNWGDGDTWIFDSADEWDGFQGEFEDYVDSQGGWRWPWQSDPEPPRPPDIITESRWGGELSAEGQLGVTAETGSEHLYSELSVDAGLELSGSYQQTVTQHTTGETAGHTTTTYDVGGSIEGGVDVGGFGAHAEGHTQGSFSVTRDENNQVTEVQFQQTRDGGGGLDLNAEQLIGDAPPGDLDIAPNATWEPGNTRTQTTVTLEVNDDNRAIVDQYLDETGPRTTAATLNWNSRLPTELADDASDFDRLLFEQATGSRHQFDISNTEAGLGGGRDSDPEGGVNVGNVGGELISETQSQNMEVVDAYYLGAENPNTGERELIFDENCIN